ncbi:NAD(P)H-dependent oxidoreductase [Paraburkholderia sp. MM5482-R1]|uniref:NAD(P)H-dependent oxidoreductase n=1 Tax=unclassified Paraburkholderia TaxID=2615204 RepID=UPI003D1A2EDE
MKMNKKTLVILGHPDLAASRVSAEFVRQLEDYPVTLHEICKFHEHFRFNVEREQALLTAHHRIVFLFPLYWYSVPALLKKWLDDVFLPGFAYAREGDKLAGKEFLVLTTVGAPPEGYRAGGFNRFTLDELLRPFQQTANYVKAKYLPAIAIYESVFLDQPTLEAEVRAACRQIVDDYVDPSQLYEQLLEKAEAQQIALLDTATQLKDQSSI